MGRRLLFLAVVGFVGWYVWNQWERWRSATPDGGLVGAGSPLFEALGLHRTKWEHDAKQGQESIVNLAVIPPRIG